MEPAREPVRVPAAAGTLRWRGSGVGRLTGERAPDRRGRGDEAQAERRLEAFGAAVPEHDAVLGVAHDDGLKGDVQQPELPLDGGALLLISDGINTYGRAELSDTVEQLRRQPVELFAIGIESDSLEDVVESVATRSVPFAIDTARLQIYKTNSLATPRRACWRGRPSAALPRCHHSAQPVEVGGRRFSLSQ